MKINYLPTAVLSLLIIMNSTIAAPLPPKEKLQLYLLIGQSNMAGRGVPEEVDQTPHPRVLLFATNQWIPATEPITKDPNKFHGVGPGLAFAKIMAEKKPDATIGLVACAVGGTPLKRWVRGADLYTNAVHQARLAMKEGTLAGILWHQGESDTGHATDANTYGERLAQMIHDLREDLGATNVPIVVGELGQFLINRPNKPVPLAKVVNEALLKIPSHVPLTGCAESKGLADKGDELHFSAPAQREFGRRYAAIMLKLEAQAAINLSK